MNRDILNLIGFFTLLIGPIGIALANPAENPKQPQSVYDKFFGIDTSRLAVEVTDSTDVVQSFQVSGDCSQSMVEKSIKTPGVLSPKSVIGGLTAIVNMGDKIWKIIESGKPNLNVESTSANALPSGVRCWDELAGWQFPKVRRYSVGYKNYFGMDVVKFDIKVLYFYGGHVDGKGKYLTNIKVVPENVKVFWSFNFDAVARVPQVVNLGTKADPIAGALIEVEWQVNSKVAANKMGLNLFVSGDGTLQEL